MALTALDFITIDGDQIYRPPTFAPQMEDIYSGEYVTCTGKTVGDRIGWKWSDMTLEWDALPQSMVDILVGLEGEATLEFDAPQGAQTEKFIRSSAVQLRNRNTIRGETIWKDVRMDIRFIGSHPKE